MKLCKDCGQPMNPTCEKRNNSTCGRCTARRPVVRRFVKVCEEFKKQIGYDDILKKRAEEAEENDEGKTASV